MPSVANNPSARWRTGEPNDGEIALSGPRVLLGDGRVVVPWREEIRYTRRRAGYHGGASLAEMAVPGIWQFDRIVPDTGAFMLPRMYGRTWLECRAAADGALGTYVRGRIEAAAPLVVVGRWLDTGHGHIFSTGKGIRSA